MHGQRCIDASAMAYHSLTHPPVATLWTWEPAGGFGGALAVTPEGARAPGRCSCGDRQRTHAARTAREVAARCRSYEGAG